MNTRQRRRAWLEIHLSVKQPKVLEFGAFDNPTYFKSEADIEYLDYFSKSELAGLHGATKPERVRNAIEVDHVIKAIDFAEQLPTQFDLLIANHVIEHVPDLIRWLDNASRCLSNSGRIFLSIPHKEYTFDKIRPLTTLSDLLLAYEEKLVAPCVRQVFESLYYYRPIRAEHVWQAASDIPKLIGQKRFQTASAAWETAKEKVRSGGLLDVHCTVFTYESFLDLMRELEVAGYTRLRVVDSANIQHLANEFYVLLN